MRVGFTNELKFLEDPLYFLTRSKCHYETKTVHSQGEVKINNYPTPPPPAISQVSIIFMCDGYIKQ